MFFGGYVPLVITISAHLIVPSTNTNIAVTLEFGQFSRFQDIEHTGPFSHANELIVLDRELVQLGNKHVISRQCPIEEEKNAVCVSRQCVKQTTMTI